MAELEQVIQTGRGREIASGGDSRDRGKGGRSCEGGNCQEEAVMVADDGGEGEAGCAKRERRMCESGKVVVVVNGGGEGEGSCKNWGRWMGSRGRRWWWEGSLT
ncbi:hypothetical protein EJ110_NYTH21186 [Nymphaea thermarum]|nr:hypothetical protein EJ110_NYTH21186 [Nymphaea thermarum]